MTEQKVKAGNVKTAVGLPTDKVISDIYFDKSDIVTDLDDATVNTKVLGAKATKDALEDKADATDIPTLVSDLTNDSGYITSSDILGKANTSDLASVATSGSYSDLSNKPSYTPTITSSETGAYKIGSININGSNVDIYGKDTNTEVNLKTINGNSLIGTGDLTVVTDISGKVDISQGNGNANKNIVTDAQGNITTEAKPIIPTVPTTVSSFTNDAGYLTSADITDKIEINVLASADALPQTGSPNVFYFVPSASSESQNSYDEFVWVNNAYEKIGVQKIDLTGYVKASELKNHISAEITQTGDFNLIFTY